jgi:hypothetical protein
MNVTRQRYPYRVIYKRTGEDITDTNSFVLLPDGRVVILGRDDLEDDYSLCCRVEFCEPIVEEE